MKNLPKEKRDRILAIAGAAVAVIALLGWFLLRPQWADLRQAAEQIEKAEEQLNTGLRLLKRAQEISDDLDQRRSELRAIENGMASGDLYSWIILTLSKFREGYNVDIPSFSREERAQVGILPEFPYEAVKYIVRGNAHYHDFGRFLADFENQFPYMRVQNLELETPDNAQTAGPEKLTFKMEVVALLKPAAE